MTTTIIIITIKKKINDNSNNIDFKKISKKKQIFLKYHR